jgi:hypothetical protein
MTLSTTTNRATFEGSGTTGPFPFLFPFTDDADISVFTVTDGVVDDLDDSEYTLTGAGDPDGGSVTTVAAVATGTTLVIMRIIALDQTTDLENQGSFYAETHEDTFDRLAMQIQQLQEEVNRCLRMPKSIGVDQTLSDSRGGTYPYFEAGGSLTYVTAVSFTASAALLTAFVTSTYEIPPAQTEVVLINSATSDCVITPQSGDTIVNAATYTLTVKDEAVHFIKTGTNWFKVN